VEERRAELIVVDASALIAAFLPDEVEAKATELLEDLQYGRAVAVVPALFYQEISNALLMAYRRKRIQRDRFLAYLRVIASLPILVDTAAATQGTTMLTVSQLAEQHTLTTYDASYLEVAMRRGLPLATLDAALAKVALGVGVASRLITA
jgi:predicted nucleic acid-binding protein